MVLTEGFTTLPFNFSDGNVKKHKKLMQENYPASSYTLKDTKLVPVVQGRYFGVTMDCSSSNCSRVYKHVSGAEMVVRDLENQTKITIQF